MIIPLLLALASADIKCPVKISVTGWLRQGAAIQILVNDMVHDSYVRYPDRLPYDTTINIAPGAKLYASWMGVATTVKGVALRMSSRSGSIIDIACDESIELCGEAEARFKLSDSCRLQ